MILSLKETSSQVEVQGPDFWSPKMDLGLCGPFSLERGISHCLSYRIFCKSQFLPSHSVLCVGLPSPAEPLEIAI